MPQARAQLQVLRQLTVADVFAENAGAVVPLLRRLVRHLALGQSLGTDMVQVGGTAAEH